MRARDLGILFAYGAVLVLATWLATDACVRAGWIVPPGEVQPVRDAMIDLR